ncbi:hypothetical protein KsCSTR_05100 [Candidatus Kuenenia stuttgartiensis]|uniref:DUF11 domain-containing protein n=1 Tax=Kuenenia stuttgartiensis TaxID=174633 RepID=Q1Q073_KUEST|nr:MULTISPECIES: CARDB domain-containing protein [Kuenenia]MBE7546513.1 DUF11 domain-containing protein [Planctomycetia bacterium]MCF6151478.1 DUF11 domain-containing protein [Candidatus Kuenenia stuttgartiensis]MCZ7621856.1 DUF11 domain-containing protein [Candidatus Kuenenia sp.]QII09889.1 hypothetical protein KsCSTR_05100 [Candidatus Kuenenia stuttgartiensis]TVM01697.1 MAG: hypothetical protein CV080_03680 [Candidatus Kuenenia stuttgartiensis]
MKINHLRKMFLVVPLFILWAVIGSNSWGSGIKHDPDEKGKHYHGHINDEPGPRHYETIHSEKEKPKPKPEPKSDMLITSMAYPTGNKDCCSVIYMEKIAPRTGAVGVPYEYVIKVTNLIDSKIDDVEVIHSLPGNFNITGSDPDMLKSINDSMKEGIAVWELGTLQPHETKIIRLAGTPTKEGKMPFCTDLEYQLPDICLEPEILQPKLLLSKKAPESVLLCDTIPLTFVVQNSGTGMARDVQIKESLPDGLTTQDGHASVIMKIGTLAPGESRTATLNVTAERIGEYHNIATAVADGGLSIESNKTSTVVLQPKLEIVNTGPDNIYLGRNITYDISVSNIGNGPASATVVTDTILANATFLNATNGGAMSAGGVKWNLGTLQPNDSKKLSITVQPNGIGTVENKATAEAVCAEAVFATVTTDVAGISAILLEVVDVHDPIEVGHDEIYIITVTNQGTDHSRNIRITCTLEDSMEYISSGGATSGTIDGEGRTVTFSPLPSLAPKATATWKVEVKALSDGDARFKVNMTDDRLTRPVEETEATHFYE